MTIPIGNRALAVVRSGESYQEMKTSLVNLRNEVHLLSSQGSIEVMGRVIPVEVFLGGDYKVRLSQLYAFILAPRFDLRLIRIFQFVF